MGKQKECNRIKPLLPWYTNGTLAPAEAAAMEQHLAECTSCRAELARWRETSTALARADANVPYDVQAEARWGQLAARLEMARGRAPRAESRRPMRIQQRSDSPSADAQEREQPPALSHHPWLAVLIAAVVILALLVGAVAKLADRGQLGPAGSTHPQPPTASNGCASGHPTLDLTGTGMNSASSLMVQGLAVAPGGDGWATYETLDDQGNTGSGGFLRYQNCTWAKVTVPEHPSWGRVTFFGIAFSSASEGWAVGVDQSSSRLVVERYSQGNWQALPEVVAPASLAWISRSGPESPAGVTYAQVYASKSGDAWILAYGNAGMSQFTLLRYNHGVWSPVPSFSRTGSITLGEASIDPHGNLWVSANDASEQPILARYAGGTWTTWQSAALGLSSPGMTAGAIQAITASDVWATIGGTVLHFDGTRWQDATPVSLPGGDGSLAPTSFTSIGVVSPTNLFFFLESNVSNPIMPPTGPLGWHYADGRWSVLQNRLPGIPTAPVIYGISSLQMMNATQGWAVGVHNRQITSSFTVGFGSLLYFDNGQWTDFGPTSPSTAGQ